MKLTLERLKLENHYCMLDEYEALASSLTIWQRIKQTWYSLCVVSDTNKVAQYFLRSTAARHAEKERHHLSRNINIIHPFSRLRLLWMMIMIFVFGALLVLLPYTHTVVITSNQDSITTAYMQYIYIITGFYAVCWLDIIMNFFTGYNLTITKQIVIDREHIICRYLAGYFIIDVISSLPVELIVRHFVYTNREVVLLKGGLTWIDAVITLVALTKILRIVTLFDYVQQVLKTFGVHLIYQRLISILLMYIMLLSWGVCIDYIIPYILDGLGLIDISLEAGDANHLPSWLHVYAVYNQTSWNKFRNAGFRFMMNLHAIGMCSPATFYIPLEETIDRPIIAFIGKAMNAYILANIMLVSTSFFVTEYKYCDMMDQLRQFMYHNHLPLRLQGRMRGFYHYRYRNTYFREHSILLAMPELMRREINMITCRRLVEDVALFKDISRDVIVSIVSVLRLEIFLEGDVIIKHGTVANCMYFLASGSVGIKLPVRGTDLCYYKQVYRLVDGDHFGEMALLDDDKPRNATVVALETCECHRLDRDDFDRTIGGSAELYKRMSTTSEWRARASNLESFEEERV